ncbi:MAG: carbohydrate-binding family 9-like protein, partial [Gammaproteobacteria bacterium]
MKKILLLTAMILAGMNTAHTAAVPTFESVRAAHNVTVSTDTQSPFWRGAKSIYLERNTWGNTVPHLRTEVLSRWTKDNLYFLFICPYQKLNLNPNPHPNQETDKLWHWDVAEVFIGWNFDD